MLTNSERQWLLNDLCSKLGICPPPAELANLEAAQPSTVEQFAEAVLRADGLEPATTDASLTRQVTAMIQAAFSRAASRPESVDYFVLDTLANDVEGFADILRLLNHAEIGWTEHLGREFNPSDVVSSLVRLIRAGNAEALVLSESGSELVGAGELVVPAIPIEELYFRMTDHGRLVHGNWTPSD